MSNNKLRQQIPRSSHANWQSAPNRENPLNLLQAQDEGRIQHLLPIKYGRMLTSPFAFLRGSAVVMASDLAYTPRTGLKVMLCGDAHLANFGLFASPERHLIFDINDFDECYLGYWEWDLKRLATSIIVAGRENGFSDNDNRDIVVETVNTYRKTLNKFAKWQTLDVWYHQLNADELLDIFDDKASKSEYKMLKKMIAKAKSRTQDETVDKITHIHDGQRIFTQEPPTLVRLSDDAHDELEDDTGVAELSAMSIKLYWQQYLESLDNDQRYLMSRYEIIDVALRVGGVGSVGTRVYIVLLKGPHRDDYLILQLKQANASALAPYLEPMSTPMTNSQRVVTGQRIMQATSDMFLGWHRHADGFDFYWRQFKDMKGSLDVTKMNKRTYTAYATACAICLASAHARSQVKAISDYLGKSEPFAHAIASFAHTYADQTEQDHALLVDAVKSGKIEAQTGV